MKKVISLMVFGFFMFHLSFAQNISISGQLGYSKATGDSFLDINGDKMVGFGLAYDADVMLHFDKFDNKLSTGLTYNSSLLFGSSSDPNTLDIGIFGLSLYGVKGEYKFLDKKFSPYASLSLGLAQLQTPDVTSGDGSILVEGETASNFGIKPEVGIYLGGFRITVAYFAPMKYEITDETAGNIQFNLGFRHHFF